MSLVEPPIRPEDVPPEPPPEDNVVVPFVVTGSILATKDVCCVCKRPVLQQKGEWCHWDPRIDRVDNPEHHVASLHVEPEVPWGFLGMKADPLVSTISRGPSGMRGAA